jgi:hypothetical protein
MPKYYKILDNGMSPKDGGASGKAIKAQSGRMNAQAARTKLGALSNKSNGRFASESVQKQASNVARTQKSMYPGTKFKGFTTVKPGRADAKPSPKKSKSNY